MPSSNMRAICSVRRILATSRSVKSAIKANEARTPIGMPTIPMRNDRPVGGIQRALPFDQRLRRRRFLACEQDPDLAP